MDVAFLHGHVSLLRTPIVRCRPSMLGVGDMEGRLWTSDSCRVLGSCSVSETDLTVRITVAGACGFSGSVDGHEPSLQILFHQDTVSITPFVSRSRRGAQGTWYSSV